MESSEALDRVHIWATPNIFQDSQWLEEDTGIIGSDLASFEACSQIWRHSVEELYQQAQAFMETRQLILVHVMGAPGREASKTEPQWCDSDDIDNAW